MIASIPLFLHLRILDVIDILLVSLLLYTLYHLLKGTAAVNIFLGILAIFVVWRLVKYLQMDLLSDLLGAFISVGFIAFIIVFQPEIRRFLLALGSPGFISGNRLNLLLSRLRHVNQNLPDIDPVVQSCIHMAKSRTGALIIVSRQNDLSEYKNTGVVVDANITAVMLETIFYKNSPLHDGAVIIAENRIKSARCILPVSANMDIPAELGLRHRAAIGVTEKSDAVAIVVSEQTGSISYCRAGELLHDLTAPGLKQQLTVDFGTKK